MTVGSNESKFGTCHAPRNREQYWGSPRFRSRRPYKLHRGSTQRPPRQARSCISDDGVEGDYSIHLALPRDAAGGGALPVLGAKFEIREGCVRGT